MEKIYMTMNFSGGREETVSASIVESNYYEKEDGEVNLVINGQVSLETLKGITRWFERNTYRCNCKDFILPEGAC